MTGPDDSAADESGVDDVLEADLDARRKSVEICDGTVSIEITPTNEEPPIKIRVLDNSDPSDPQTLESTYRTAGVLMNRDKRLNFIRNLPVPEAVAKQEFRDELSKTFAALADALHEGEAALAKPKVKKLIRATESVTPVVIGGDTEFHVQLTVGGRTRTLEFTAGEWATENNPHPMNKQFTACFYESPKLSGEDWQQLRDAWAGMRSEAETETATRDAAVGQMTDRLATALTPYDTKEPLATDPDTAYYDAENSEPWDEAPDGEPVLWVVSNKIGELLNQENIGVEPNQLATWFRETGVMYATTEQKSISYGPEGDRDRTRRYIWPLDPRELGIPGDYVFDADERGPETEDTEL